MAFNTPLTYPNLITLGRGTGYFAQFDANNRPMGEVDLGELTEVLISGESDQIEFVSKRTSVATTVAQSVTRVRFAGKFTSASLSDELLAMFFAGAKSTASQSSGTVSSERIYNARSGRHYQIGASASALSGARNLSAVSVYLYELKNASARVDSTAYTKGQIYKSSSNVFLVTTAGTSAASPPSFVTTSVGASTTDGTATVKYLGTTSAFTLDTHYILSAEAGRVGIIAGANLALACDLYEATVPGSYLSLEVAYTTAAITMTDIRSTNAGVLKGQFRWVSDNSEGTNRDLFIPYCTLKPAAELSLVGDDYANIGFDLGISQLDSDTPQVLLNGRPVTA